MGKRPSFQFYPPDWRTDEKLRLCSIAARGLWIDMLCLMHAGEPYGHLCTVPGRPTTPEGLAKQVGESPAAVKRWLAELADNGVYSVTDDGLIYSRRMVRDERLRDLRAAGGVAGAEHGAKGASHGSKGGRPRKSDGGNSETERGDKKPPLKPPPSSSSSSPDSSEDKSSGGDATGKGDLDAAAWASARAILVDQGGMAVDAAGKFFGKLLSQHGLQARDLLAPLSECLVNGTRDPKSYLTRAAQARARRKSTDPPKRVGFV